MSKTKPTVDQGRLAKQIKALLSSNLKEGIKTGLHELLGTIYDGIADKGRITLIKLKRRK